MNALAQSLEMVPESYQDDTFDIVVRDNRSVAVFWDLAESSKRGGSGARLSLRVQNETAGAEETLPLSHDAGHMIVPLADSSRTYQIELGWANSEGFSKIADDSVELPPLVKMQAHHEANFYGAAVERRGFRPAKDL